MTITETPPEQLDTHVPLARHIKTTATLGLLRTMTLTDAIAFAITRPETLVDRSVIDGIPESDTSWAARAAARAVRHRL